MATPIRPCRPGECAWADRGIAANERAVLYLDIPSTGGADSVTHGIGQGMSNEFRVVGYPTLQTLVSAWQRLSRFQLEASRSGNWLLVSGGPTVVGP